MNQGSTRRCFIAIPVDDVVRDDLCEMMSRVEIRGMRKTLRENMHVTVKFLGDIEDDWIGLVIESLTEVVKGISVFELNTCGVIWLPNERRARVLAIEINSPAALMGLVERIEDAMSDVGFQREGRLYRPHITLGRFRRAIRGELERVRGLETGFAAEAVVLMESELRRDGAVYNELARFALE